MVLRALGPGNAGVGARRGRGRGPGRAAPAPGDSAGARASSPPAAGNTGPFGRGAGDGRRLRRNGGSRRSAARRHAGRFRGVSRRGDGALSARGERDRAVPALRRGPARGAAGQGGSAVAAVRRCGAVGRRSVSAGARLAGGQPNDRRGGPDARGRIAGRAAAARAGGGRRHRLGDRIHPPRASGRTVRLYVHRHLRRVFRRCGGAFRRRGRFDRLPGTGYRERPLGPGFSSPTHTT